MKKIPSIKWMLMGIALILLFPMFSTVSESYNPSYFWEAVGVISLIAPFAGIAFCIYGFLKKDEP